MFRISGLVWPCLPFGWNCSPWIAQSCLERLVNLALSGQMQRGIRWDVFLYYDDILVLDVNRDLCTLVTSALVHTLRSAGLLVSDKSCLEPSQDVTWLGKRRLLAHSLVLNTKKVLLHTLALSVLLCCIPLHRKVIDRATGYLLCAMRPHLWATMNLRAWYLAPLATARCLRRATQTMRNSLADCVLYACLPWRAPALGPPPLLMPLLAVDAAMGPHGFQVGLVNTIVGARVELCPAEVRTQQQAELYGLDCATRLAVRLGWNAVSVITYSQAAGHLLLSLRPTLRNQTLTQCLRRIRNRLLVWAAYPRPVVPVRVATSGSFQPL